MTSLEPLAAQTLARPTSYPDVSVRYLASWVRSSTASRSGYRLRFRAASRTRSVIRSTSGSGSG